MKPNDEYLFAKDIRKAALAAKLWDGKEPLDFAQVFAPDPRQYGTGSPPVPLYSSLRRWRLLSLAAPSLNLKLEFDQRKLPFSVKVETPVTHRDVMKMMSDGYEGTEFDMTQGILAGPYRTPFRVEGGPTSMGDVPRGISILRTLYSTITETGPSQSLVWYAPDTPKTSVYVPLDHRAASGVSWTFSTGNHHEFDRTAAWWAFGFVNNWMQLNYEGMSEQDVYPMMKEWQDKIDAEWGEARQADPKLIKDWQIHLQEQLAASWWGLADRLVWKYNDMSTTTPNVTDRSDGYPEWYAKMIGYSQDVHPIWVQPVPRPDATLPGYVASTVVLPRAWDESVEQWVDWALLPMCPSPDVDVDMGLAAMAPGSLDPGLLAGPIALVAALSAGVGASVGFAVGRRRGERSTGYLLLE